MKSFTGRLIRLTEEFKENFDDGSEERVYEDSIQATEKNKRYPKKGDTKGCGR